MNLSTVVGDELKALWSGGKGITLLSVSIAWGLVVGVRMVYPVIVPSLQTHYGLSLTLSGLLITILWLFYAVGQLPGGMLADRFNERRLMAASTLITAAAIGVLIVSPTALVLFVATAVWGLGSSLYPVARITYITNLYSEHPGSALGVTLAASDIGQTVLPPIAAFLAVAIAWQAGLGFTIPLLVLAGVSLLVVAADYGAADRQSSNLSLRSMPSVASTLRTPAIGGAAVVFFLYMFIWQGFTAFYPTYLITIKGLSPGVASVLFGFFFAVGVVVKPISGATYDRIGIRGSLISILVPPVGGFLLLPFVDSVWILVGITALISTMLGLGAVTQSYLAETLPDDMQGMGLGVIQTVTSTLAATGPVIFGVIADYGYLDEGYIGLAVVVAIAIALVVRMPKN